MKLGSLVQDIISKPTTTSNLKIHEVSEIKDTNLHLRTIEHLNFWSSIGTPQYILDFLDTGI